MMDKQQSETSARNWLAQLQFSKKEDEQWCKRAKKVVKRYRDERRGWSDNTKRYSMLWANVQTTMPALYGKTPRAQVERRWKDQDPVGRTASIILERALQYEIDHYGDYDNAIRSAVNDLLLPGRGTVWVRFESKEVEIPEVVEEQQEMAAEAQGLPEPPDYEYECTPTDYVFWEDFRCSPARTWDEVTWVARRVYMSRRDGLKRFGEMFEDVPLTHEPIGLDEMKNQGGDDFDGESMKKAQVWEIWDKTTKCVYWVAEGYGQILDKKEDPYGLDCFWPCPKPLFATQTTDTLVPIPDYSLYQDQAEEIDKLTNRISMLVEAVKVVGVYDASQDGVQRMLSEGTNNTLIPVNSWAAFSEKGGLKGTVEFMPLDSVLLALRECYASREQAKQVIYEVTGLSDIIRGASVASETATAQQIKSQYGSLRLKARQMMVAQFASEILRIKAQMMADLYKPGSLIQMSGIMGTDDAIHAEQAVMLLKQEPARNFRIEVAADSLVEMDEQAEKASRVEFLGAVGQFMERALPVAQQVPELAPLMGEMLLFGVRAFKGGRPMEGAFDDAIAKLTAPKPPSPPQPNPEEMKAQAEMQRAQATMQLEQAKMQSSQQLEQVKMQQSMELEQFKAQQMMALEQIKQDAETQRAQMRAQIDAQTKIEIAAMQAQAAEKPTVTIDGNQQLSAVGDEVRQMAQQSTQGIAEAMAMLSAAIERMSRPKRRQLERGPDGRAIGVIEIEE